MGRSTIVVGWLALVALSLRPVEFVERAAGYVFEPTRLVCEIAAPFAGSSRAAAAGERVAEVRDEVRALLYAEQQGARPAPPALVAGRGLVHAQVVDRSEEKPDLIVVRYSPQAVIEPGMPVVCGEVCVGTVAEVGRVRTPSASAPRTRELDALRPGEARVRLLTAEDSRIGARAGAVELVAGGLVRTERARGKSSLLAVRALQTTPEAGGDVRVEEHSGAPGDWSALANGYRLGALVALPLGTRTSWAIQPALDFRGGFSQVFVLCPAEHAPAGALLAQDPFAASAWISARVALAGTPSFWRETRKLCAGSRAGVRAGAAAADGAELVGRVTRVGLWTSDLECLGDPGFRVLLLARVQGIPVPLHLGRATSLGTDASHETVYLAWETSAELARTLGGRGTRTAVLYTGSGERSLPPGLHLGTAELACTSGAHVLALRREHATIEAGRVSVWRGNESAEEAP